MSGIYTKEAQYLVKDAERGGTVVVDTEGQKSEVEIRIRECRPFDNIRVVTVPLEEYDAERFIIDLDDR